MKYKVLFFVLLLVLNVCLCKDFTVGTRANNLLISTQKVMYNAIPLIKRDKEYSFVDPKDRVIKGIIARDLDRSHADVTISDGGIGKTHVTLHLQSERSARLNYLILIFTNKID